MSQVLAVVSASSLDAFIDGCFKFLPAIVRCDFVSVLYRRTDNALLFERDSRGRSYGPEFMLRYAELTPATRLARQQPGVRVLPSRLGLPGSDAELKAMPFYREVMQPQGWRHAVALCLWSEDHAFPSLVVTVNRREGRRDFTDRDIERLERAQRILEAAALHVREHLQARALSDTIASGPDERGWMFLDRHARPIRFNIAAASHSATWIGQERRSRIGASKGLVVPPDIRRACRDMCDDWRAGIGRRGRRRVTRRHIVHDGPHMMLASVTMIAPESDGIEEPAFVVETENLAAASSAASGADRVLAKLTLSERRLADLMAQGLSNQEIADSLVKSVAAVKFAVHRLYRKLGIDSRARLVALMNR